MGVWWWVDGNVGLVGVDQMHERERQKRERERERERGRERICMGDLGEEGLRVIVVEDASMGERRGVLGYAKGGWRVGPVFLNLPLK